MIVTRMLLEPRDEEADWRVVRVDAGMAWMRRRGTPAWPEPMAVEDVLARIEDGSVRLAAEAPAPGGELSPKAERLQRARFEILRPLIAVDVAPLLVIPSERSRLFKERLAELEGAGEPSSVQNLGNIVRVWWDGGMTYHALAPALHRCGAPGRPRSNLGGKVGRPRRRAVMEAEGPGINIGEDGRRKLAMAANMYLTGKGDVTLAGAHRWLCETFYSDAEEDAAGRVTVVVRKDRPTLRQLQHYMLARFPRHVRRRLKMGVREYLLSGRELTSRADHDVRVPGDRYEIDATIADAYVVSVHDPQVIVGRPVVYSVVDAYSRMVVGIYVGLEGPSWVGAMMALVNMVTPKAAYCAAYGIHIEEREWPCHHAPKSIMADRGELLSHKLGENIIKNLHIDIENVAPYRGDMKGIVERSHRTLPTIWAPHTPGYVHKDFNERGAADYRLRACLNLNEFTATIIRSVLIANGEPNTKRRATPGMVAEGLTPAPLDYWDYGVRNLAPRLNHLSADQVALEVMPTGNALVTSRGIEFRGRCYDGELARREEWYARARSGHTWKVRVSFDPRRLDLLYLRTGVAPNAIEKLRPMEIDAERCEASLWEEDALAARARVIVRVGETDRLSRRITHEHAMAETRKAAEMRLKDALAGSTQSDAARVKGIRQNRAAERKARGAAEALALGPPEPSPAPQPSETRPKMSRVARLVHGGSPK